MCFGLAAGLNFTYVREFGAPFFLVMGRGSYMESHFCDAIEAQLEVSHADDAELAWQHLKACIDAKQLAMVDTDMFELPYMVQRLNLPEGMHFGGHKLLVTGYDEAAGTVQLADYAWLEPRVVALDRFKIARDSRECPSRPRNACFVFHFPDELPPRRRSIRAALATVVNQMRHPFRQYNGLPAIERFCRQVTKWHLSMQGEDLRRNLALAAFMLERAGTGGGAFRNLYARFMAEAADELGAAAIAESARLYRSLAMRWREAAALLDAAAEDPATGMFAPGPAARQLMAAIDAEEHQAIELIATYLADSRHTKALQ